MASRNARPSDDFARVDPERNVMHGAAIRFDRGSEGNAADDDVRKQLGMRDGIYALISTFGFSCVMVCLLTMPEEKETGKSLIRSGRIN
jgi:hypothetical protein